MPRTQVHGQGSSLTHTYTRVCTHTLTHVHSLTQSHTNTHSHTRSLSHTYTHVHTHALTSTHTRTHTYTHTLTRTHTHALTQSHTLSDTKTGNSEELLCPRCQFLLPVFAFGHRGEQPQLQPVLGLRKGQSWPPGPSYEHSVGGEGLLLPAGFFSTRLQGRPHRGQGVGF